jgi:site-specific recombinase XerC
LRAWFEIMRDGSAVPPRCKPRNPDTIRLKLRWALPSLRAWAASGHASLREITREEVIVALPPSGTPRATAGADLRSVFTILKAKKVVFTNPTAGIRTGSPETREPLPAAVSQLRQALAADDDPLRAAAAALLAYCGLEPRQLPRLLLIDICDGRLHLPGRTVPLADPVLDRVAAWLDERQRCWPMTANPHLFINKQNATRTSAVQADWITKRLGTSAQTIREDRIPDEAQASRGDVRRLIALFGLSVEGALRYTATVDHPAIAALAAEPPPG